MDDASQENEEAEKVQKELKSGLASLKRATSDIINPEFVYDLDHVLSSPENLQHFIEAILDQWTPEVILK